MASPVKASRVRVGGSMHHHQKGDVIIVIPDGGKVMSVSV